MINLLDSAMVAIKLALKDAPNGMSSKLGWKTMFKSPVNAAFVLGMLKRLSTFPQSINLGPDVHLPTSARFACVTPGFWSLYPWLLFDPYEWCSINQGLTSFYAVGQAYIFLCPKFWTFPPSLVASRCPEVVDNFITLSASLQEATFSQYQDYILIHELIHFYLQSASLGGYTIPNEQYTLNTCILLGAADSLNNPSNYQNYIAGKLFLLVQSRYRTLSGLY